MPIAFLIANWRWIAIAAFFAVTHGWVFYRGIQWEKPNTKAAEARMATFEAKVAAEGREASQRAVLKAQQDKLRKDQADAKHAQTVAALDTALRGLRATADSRKRDLPAAPAGSSRPDLVCFDRVEYQREDGAAFERLRAGARSLADEGTAGALKLANACEWAQGK